MYTPRDGKTGNQLWGGGSHSLDQISPLKSFNEMETNESKTCMFETKKRSPFIQNEKNIKMYALDFKNLFRMQGIF